MCSGMWVQCIMCQYKEPVQHIKSRWISYPKSELNLEKKPKTIPLVCCVMLKIFIILANTFCPSSNVIMMEPDIAAVSPLTERLLETKNWSLKPLNSCKCNFLTLHYRDIFFSLHDEWWNFLVSMMNVRITLCKIMNTNKSVGKAIRDRKCNIRACDHI